MKSVVMKSLKALLIFIIATVILYMIFTISYLFSWAKENQLKLFTKDLASDIPNLNKDKIQEMGDYVGDYAKLLEESLDESYYEEFEDYHPIAEYHHPLGFSVWSFLREEIVEIVDRYDTLSIVLGSATTIAYIIITSKNINNIFKIILGYIGLILVIPPIYTYISNFRLIPFLETYSKGIPKIFYIVYTAIFVLIYIVNYIVGKNMAKELNKTIEKGGDYYEQDK